jgi:hypothetical protein
MDGQVVEGVDGLSGLCKYRLRVAASYRLAEILAQPNQLSIAEHVRTSIEGSKRSAIDRIKRDVLTFKKKLNKNFF